MITHYIANHHYAPPSEFVDAALACPAPASAAYEERMRPFLDCWSAFVPVEELLSSLREHREDLAANGVRPARKFTTLDGPDALDSLWYAAVVGGLDSSPIAIAKVAAAYLHLSPVEALARLRVKSLLVFATVAEAETWAERLRAAGATVEIGKRPQD